MTTVFQHEVYEVVYSEMIKKLKCSSDSPNLFSLVLSIFVLLITILNLVSKNVFSLLKHE